MQSEPCAVSEFWKHNCDVFIGKQKSSLLKLLGIKHLVCPSVCQTFEDTLVLTNSKSVWGLRLGFKVEVREYTV